MLPKKLSSSFTFRVWGLKTQDPSPQLILLSNSTVLVQITDCRPPQDGVTLFFLRLLAALSKKSKPFTDDEDWRNIQLRQQQRFDAKISSFLNQSATLQAQQLIVSMTWQAFKQDCKDSVAYSIAADVSTQFTDSSMLLFQASIRTFNCWWNF
jgi:hypothetical protein